MSLQFTFTIHAFFICIGFCTVFSFRLLPHILENERDDLSPMTAKEAATFKNYLDVSIGSLSDCVDHLFNLHIGLLDDEPKPAVEDLAFIQGGLTLLQRFRVQAAGIGFAAGESLFVVLLEKLLDKSEVIQFHFKQPECKATILLKTSVIQWKASVESLYFYASDPTMAEKLYVETTPPEAICASSHARIPTSSRSPMARIRTPRKTSHLLELPRIDEGIINVSLSSQSKKK